MSPVYTHIFITPPPKKEIDLDIYDSPYPSCPGGGGPKI